MSSLRLWSAATPATAWLTASPRGEGVFCDGAAFGTAVVAVFDDAAVISASRGSDAVASAVAAVAGQAGMVGQCSAEGFAQDDDVVAVTRPGVPDGDDAVACPADDLHVDAASVVLALAVCC
jgi:hypothetical protein